jgi:hypothetical protein
MPSLAALQRRGPVDIAGRGERVQLARAAGCARQIFDLDAIGFSSAFTGRPSERLHSVLKGYQRAVVWMRGLPEVVKTFEGFGVRTQALPGLPPAEWAEPAYKYYLQALALPEEPPARLRVTPAAEWDVLLHPGSGSHRKNWPRERFLALAEELQSRMCSTAWLLGPAEEEWMPPARAAVLRPASPMELARNLAGARLHIGNDSGVSHLAAALGVPTVAIFGPTDPRVWAPQGEQVRVATGASWPSVDQVLEALSHPQFGKLQLDDPPRSER